MIARAFFLPTLTAMILVTTSVAIDQTTKSIAEHRLMVWEDPSDLRAYEGRSHLVWESGVPSDPLYLRLGFAYVRNQGAAWGMFSNLEDKVRIPFFYIVIFLAISMILYYLWVTPMEHQLVRVALYLILSGAIGNFMDRVMHGYVIDFLDVQWSVPFGSWTWAYDFPKFNWADSMITIGLGLMVVDMLFFESKRHKAEESTGSPDELG